MQIINMLHNISFYGVTAAVIADAWLSTIPSMLIIKPKIAIAPAKMTEFCEALPLASALASLSILMSSSIFAMILDRFSCPCLFSSLNLALAKVNSSHAEISG